MVDGGPSMSDELCKGLGLRGDALESHPCSLVPSALDRLATSRHATYNERALIP